MFPDRGEYLAEKYGTPLFVYARERLDAAAETLRNALGPRTRLLYAIKANPNPAIAAHFAAAGLGTEVASRGELHLALACGIAPSTIVFAGPAKTDADLRAAVAARGSIIAAESVDELQAIQRLCGEARTTASVALRLSLPAPTAKRGRIGGWHAVGPFDIDPATLPRAIEILPRLDRIHCVGIHNHQSSGSLDAEDLVERFEITLRTALGLEAAIDLRLIDFGGGFGSPFYADDPPLDLEPIRRFFQGLHDQGGALEGRSVEVVAESGRFLTGSAGFYLTRVVSTKTSSGLRFATLDGGVHHVLGLSGAFRTLRRPVLALCCRASASDELVATELVGPLCTPIDRLAGAVPLPADLRSGDLLVFPGCGAYAKHASPLDFLGHAWPAEVLIAADQERLVARRVDFAEVLDLQRPSGAWAP